VLLPPLWSSGTTVLLPSTPRAPLPFDLRQRLERQRVGSRGGEEGGVKSKSDGMHIQLELVFTTTEFHLADSFTSKQLQTDWPLLVIAILQTDWPTTCNSHILIAIANGLAHYLMFQSKFPLCKFPLYQLDVQTILQLQLRYKDNLQT
jgi:hypothetical protein